MKRRRLLVLSCTLCLIMVLTTVSLTTACAPKAAEVVELKLAYSGPPTTPLYLALMEWAGKVEEQTQGRVKITGYPAEALVKYADQYSSVVSGISDITYIVTTSEPDRFALNNVLGLMALSVPVDDRGIKIWDELWDKFPEMKDEYADVKVLWHWAAAPFNVHTTKKLVRVPDDIRGMKMLVSGPDSIRLVEEAGATPVTSSIYDYPMSLERGLGEGFLSSYIISRMLKLEELTSYHLSLWMGATGQSVVMNLDQWNSLPRDTQKIIDDLSPWACEQIWKGAFVATDLAAEKYYQDLGQAVTVPTAAERQLWLDLGLPRAEEWITQNEAKGKPARAIFEEAQQLVKKYSQ